MNPVLDWLHSHDGYSFDEGVAILLCFSANTSVNKMIMRRRDRRHLGAELSRLAHIPNLRPLPGMEAPKHEAKEPEPVKAAEDSQRDEGPTQGKESVKKTAKDSEPEPEGEDDDDIVSFLDLKRYEREDPEKLPPTLKPLWLENRDEYKELQYCHAQMKQANNDTGRAEWRRQVIEHRESLQKRWRLFDEEKKRLAEEPKQDIEEKHYNPFNDRANISKALKLDKWNDKKRLNVQRWVDALVSHNIPISEETLNRLKERGISV